MAENESLLGHIKSPRDLSTLRLSELNSLCAEIRRVIIDTVAKNGGHLSSNLGVVELTVALHTVFDSPHDKIVWDVGHQCYAHKLLTGRQDSFATLRQSGGMAGFPRRSESEHDAFDTGHASTSISVALGLLQAECALHRGTFCDTEGSKSNSLMAASTSAASVAGPSAASRGAVIAVIGDGALTGGLAYEALSGAGHLGLPLVVLLNDNRMSISPNVGSLSKHLSRLSATRKYQNFRVTFDSIVEKIPYAGKRINALIWRLKRAIKAIFYHDNFFVDMGFEYVGPIDGHSLSELLSVLKNARALNRPVVVHIITQKGRGYPQAERDPGAFHSVPPFDAASGTIPRGGETWTAAFGQAIVQAARKNDKVVAVTAAMERGTGLSAFRGEFPARFFDAGIAEAHAVSFSAALASRGFRPVVAIYSTFIQRSVDSVIHDCAICALPVIFALDRAGFVSGDGETHQGLFDIALFRAVPGMTILAPATGSELSLLLNYALERGSPCAIRYPKAILPDAEIAFDAPVVVGRGILIKEKREEGGEASPSLQPPTQTDGLLMASSATPSPRGSAPKTPSSVCLAFTGSLWNEAKHAAEILAGKNISVDLYNLRFIKPLDEEYIKTLASGYEHFVVAEEGCAAGGVGEYIARICARTSVHALNAGDKFYSVGTREELLSRAGLDGEGIAGYIERIRSAEQV